MKNVLENLQRGQGLQNLNLAAATHRLRGYAIILLASTGLCCWASLNLLVSHDDQVLSGEYAYAGLTKWLSGNAAEPPKINISIEGRQVPIRATTILQIAEYQQSFRRFKLFVSLGASSGFFIGLGACYGWTRWLSAKGEEIARDDVLRGTHIVSEQVLSRHTRGLAGPHPVRIGTVAWPAHMETRHAALIGTTGSGKTTVLRQLLDVIEQRAECAIVYDTSGEFVAHYFDPSRHDIILNPFDARGVYWNPFNEICHPADADRIAGQLVPDSGSNEDSVWTTASRNLLANMIRELWREGRTNIGDLIEAVQSLSKNDLKEWLEHTSSSRIFAEDADRATGSVLFMLTKAAAILQYLRTGPRVGGAFNFREFFKGLDAVKGRKPWIFVARKEDYFEAMKPLMSTWLDCASTSILGLEPSNSRRVWLLLDELPDIPKVDQLLRLLPQGRKFGASVVITLQSIGQMHERYGREGAEAMLGCVNTKLFLQTIDSDTRLWISKTLGDVEVEIHGTTNNLDFEHGKGRTSLGTTRQLRPAVIESQLRLPPHSGYLQFPDGLPIALIRLRNVHIITRGEPKHPAFIPGDISETHWGQKKLQAKQDHSCSPILPTGGPV
ncbi:type IV secretion system DNA-binding domain-containing protein [Asticcacaulis excentricus]|uniref:IncF plasmid conjugative transfer protein TraD n=1 Tax=Asticcacaulis excentricus TaxID=78587 RepID=A0A3G9G6Q8_9CAUL|nr:type IV secretion system DNA-binding domain-containing protein [Asticcacaulis excentricus]BBF79938.1 IncF plasmid conjugative transfer protein TraD [Asticcacaulis excentricus]